MDEKKNYFQTLNDVNVGDKTEKKNGLTYLSWAWAWAEVKKRFPDATYTIYENKDGLFYHTDGNTAWVKTGVTVNGIEHIEYLPVMDYRNQSIRLDKLTSFDVNKTIQRSLTKACARHGLGLYIYAGEDLPEGESDTPPAATSTAKKTASTVAQKDPHAVTCFDCGAPLTERKKKDGTIMSIPDVASFTYNRYGKRLCTKCANAAEAKIKEANNA